MSRHRRLMRPLRSPMRQAHQAHNRTVARREGPRVPSPPSAPVSRSALDALWFGWAGRVLGRNTWEGVASKPVVREKPKPWWHKMYPDKVQRNLERQRARQEGRGR